MLPLPLAASLFLAVAVGGAARGQQMTPPPAPPPVDVDPPPALDPCAGEHAADPGCPGHSASSSGGASIPVGELPVPKLPAARSSSSSSSSGGGSLSGLDGEAALAVVVIVAMAAPIIVYALDEPAEQVELDRWAAPSAKVELGAGTVGGPGRGVWLGVFSARASGGFGSLGLDASVESSPAFAQYGAIDGHLLLRPMPRVHIEGAIALGFRRVSYDGRVREGFEFSMPHRYIIRRNGPQSMGVDVRPGVFIGPQGADFRLETGFTVPLGQLASFTAGARAYSFDKDVRFGFTGSVSATF